MKRGAKKDPEQELNFCGKQIEEELKSWDSILERGCNDPQWPDGINLNLIRNHIIYYKQECIRLSKENGAELPAACFLPTPPEVDNDYMAGLLQKERVKRLEALGNRLTLRRPDISEQCTML